ncbi:two-component system, chemotaxis family, response regulator CheB [Persephonella hydrogeniphila]|uniref:Protein-glutamate methylesterase/protein-glutamine glutaminase n=1 Tax=Persephonella hydrogeniphila TaxID=198703 RepID=A0A285NKZ8_9AQUI|nr:chemotaxis-specific protein-glutamate methyltransferase CheB [Persephonella hydrogeniphila]SNZ10135.1 two-component system, chemotaxis family, response regulator CheB [Persephonella hydrogeniphila]
MKKKVLVVDDSALVRRILTKILTDMGLEVDTAKDGKEAVEKALSKDYDLITVDIEMPHKNGIQVIKEIMDRKPTRILVISAYTTEDAQLTLEALDNGALGFITKPSKIGTSLQQIEEEIKQKVSEILKVPKFKILMNRKKASKLKEEFLNLKSIDTGSYDPKEDLKYILIGASTGGPRLIETIAVTLPENYPYPICVVQHMPVNFTKKFAERLNSLSKLNVVEASNGEEVVPGKMIIGKGGWHLHFSRRSTDNTVICKLAPNTAGRFFVPSVDEMFFSALEVIDPKKIMAILLTGIGDDGADGMVALKKAGAYTIAESEETAIVYGMPKEAYLRGGATKVLPFPEIVKEILRFGARDELQKV